MSKQAEAIKLLRDMNEAELGEHLKQQRRKLFELRFQQATGQVENHRQVRDVRHEIARTMTVQIELQRVLAAAPAQADEPAAPERQPRRRRRAAATTEVAEPAETPETEATDGNE